MNLNPSIRLYLTGIVSSGAEMNCFNSISFRWKSLSLRALSRPAMLLAIVWLPLGLWAQGKSDVTKSDMAKPDFSALAANREKLKAGDPALKPALEQLLKAADRSLSYGPVSVMDKKDLPPSGDKHDYMSLAPYWWPDPNKPDGMPYIRKDGEVNPEVKKYTDKEHLPRLCEHIYQLSLAYYYSGREVYANHAATLIRAWFIDKATRMNPHLKYGQAVKGVTEGRAEGLIDTRHFIFVIDGIRMIGGSKAWKDADQQAMQGWFSEFLNWMQTSRIGIEEMNAQNNHAVWYDAQRLAIAIFIGDRKQADKIMEHVVEGLDKEMDETGAFPRELVRTISLHYSVFIFNAYYVIAELSKSTSIDLWKHKTPSGKSLQKGLDFLVPFLAGDKTWTWPQIKEFNAANAYPILWMGARNLSCQSCLPVLDRISRGDLKQSLIRLL